MAWKVTLQAWTTKRLRWCSKELKGTHSSWANVEARGPWGSILESLFFMICINDFSDSSTSNSKLFTDYTSLLSTAYDKNLGANNLNNDSVKISLWALQTIKWTKIK